MTFVMPDKHAYAIYWALDPQRRYLVGAPCEVTLTNGETQRGVVRSREGEYVCLFFRIGVVAHSQNLHHDLPHWIDPETLGIKQDDR
jgi:hypothetical protein